MTRWPTVDRSPTPTGWARPGNLMPAVGPSSWPRGRRAMTEAEEILATAEAWWDVDRSGFRDGDRYLRNIGTAGSALDLRLGSSGVANSNDPKWLGPQDTGYVYLPGTSNSHLSAPNESALQITGDLDLIARIALDETATASNQGIICKSDVSTQRSWEWRYTGGVTGFQFEIGSNGSAVTSVTSTSLDPYANGATHWVRVTWRASDGRVQFFTAPDQLSTPSSWTQLGTDKTAAVGSIFVGTATVNVGTRANTVSQMSGRIYRAQVLNGINGTTVLDVDADAITSGAATSFTATTGQTVTINRASSGRKSVAVPARAKGGRPCMLLGTDDYLECQDAAQHGLLNFGQGDSFTVLAVARKFGSSTGVIICKQRTLLVNQGWSLNHEASTILHGIHDGIALNVLSLTNTLGAQNVVIATRQDKVLGLRSDSTSTTGTQTNAGDARSFQTVRVGNQGGAGNYGNFEFRAAAVFRRALTAREISVIANAAPWGV